MRYIFNIYSVIWSSWVEASVPKTNLQPVFNAWRYVEPVEPAPWCGDGSDSLRDHIWIWYEHMKQPKSATSKHQGSQQFSKKTSQDMGDPSLPARVGRNI